MKLIFVLSALAVVMSSLSCEKPLPPRDMMEELTNMRHREGVGIGAVYDHTLDLIMFDVKPSLRQVKLSSQVVADLTTESKRQNTAATIGAGTDGRSSPDGKWLTYRTPENKFVLADSSGKIVRVLLPDGERILTPLRWSPNSEFLMYVERAGTWEGGFCAMNLADGRDVTVYRVRDGQRGIVLQVCDGYPYGGFNWIHIPPQMESNE